MKRFNSNVSTAKSALQQGPEILQAIRVDSAVNVPFGVIYNVMDKVVANLVVADCVICVNLRPVFDVLKQNVLQGFSGYVRYDLGTHLAKIPVEYSLYYSL